MSGAVITGSGGIRIFRAAMRLKAGFGVINIMVNFFDRKPKESQRQLSNIPFL